MTQYFIKPIVWNAEAYKAPAGARFTSGFPKETGFGHEEWNNSDDNIYEETNGELFRVFHTEGLGTLTDEHSKSPQIAKYAGEICIFMIASYKGQQYLVGIAQNATYIHNKNNRHALAKKLNAGERWKDAWAIQQVRKCYSNNKAKFLQDWHKDVPWIPNWKCPVSSFKWFEQPITLDALQLTGKKRFITMYKSYQEISSNVAKKIFDSLPSGTENIRDKIPTGEQISDIEAILKNTSISKTEKQTLVNARMGQGQFRKDLMKI